MARRIRPIGSFQSAPRQSAMRSLTDFNPHRVVVFSKRPAVIDKELAIEIPYPRSSKTRFLPEFTELERQAGVALGIVHQ